MNKLIAWVEIPAVDIKRAINFYNVVFNLSLELMDCGKEKMACFPNGEGAISLSPGFKPSQDGTLASFNAGEDMDAALLVVQQKGGKVFIPKTKIEAENRGYFAIVSDSEGNKIGLYGN